MIDIDSDKLARFATIASGVIAVTNFLAAFPLGGFALGNESSTSPLPLGLNVFFLLFLECLLGATFGRYLVAAESKSAGTGFTYQTLMAATSAWTSIFNIKYFLLGFYYPSEEEKQGNPVWAPDYDSALHYEWLIYFLELAVVTALIAYLAYLFIGAHRKEQLEENGARSVPSERIQIAFFFLMYLLNIFPHFRGMLHEIRMMSPSP